MKRLDHRKTATKTNSPIDRLRKLTLPAVDDVREGLASYRETRERADELAAKIERTDALIDEIVYELYGLTEEKIEIVEVGGGSAECDREASTRRVRSRSSRRWPASEQPTTLSTY